MNPNEWKGYAIEKIVQQVGHWIDKETAKDFIQMILSSKQ